MATGIFGHIDLPPGIVRDGTQYQVTGRWYDGNLVRWLEGRMRPVGGWARVGTTAVTGKAREMLSWADNSGDRWIAVGTSSKLYATFADGVWVDITPAGFVAGFDDATESFGFGGGTYGTGTYGTPRVGGTYIPMAIWSLDNWGQNLVACERGDGRIYEWSLNTLNDAVVVTNAPVDNVAIVVSDERHLIALGAGGNPRSVKWSDKEANTVWTPAANNEAGGFELHTQGQIKTGIRTRGQILVLTTTDAHALRYIGQPFVYSRERVGAECGCVAPGSLISVETDAFWMGDGRFWQFDGSRVFELPCDVSDHVFGNINRIQIEKVVAGHNPRFSEIWWHYPSNGSSENDRYVSYNYQYGFWMIGQIARTCWDGGSVFGSPYAMGADNYLYHHEQDWTANGTAMYPDIYAESGAMELGKGEQVVHVTRLIPDEETRGEVTVTFKTRFAPNGTEYTHGPYAVKSDGKTDVRFSGRQASMRVQPVADGNWSIGKFRVEMRPGSAR